MYRFVIWDTPYMPLKGKLRFGPTRRRYLQDQRISQRKKQHQSKWQDMLVTCSACWALKMEAVCSSETIVAFQLTTLRYSREDETL
jgi:hypothetical protein